MDSRLDRILISPEAISRRVAEIGRDLTDRFRDRDPLVVAVMHGCVLFLADLVRQMPIPLDLEFVYCRAYRGTRCGSVEFAQRATLPDAVRGRHVILIDDIFDTGRTIARVAEQLRALGAAEVVVVVLLQKTGCAAPGLPPPDLVGFQIENFFAVGYGLDYNGRYRNLPYIGVLRPELLEADKNKSA
jgi:hypoxanthine phosphoribosyltransferase